MRLEQAAEPRFPPLVDGNKIRPCVLIREGSFTVRNFHDEPDYSAEVEATFDKFKQGVVADYLAKYSNAPEDMNHIEAKILELVARLNPEPFSRLLDYCARHPRFIDDSIAVFEREIQFYLRCLNLTAKLEHAGLQFCLPQVSASQRASAAGRDSTALKLVEQGKSVVRNDFDLVGSERIIVVSGQTRG